jgi:hypothetical protein
MKTGAISVLTFIQSSQLISPAPQVINLSMETSLKCQVSDWLKWQLVAISANQMLEI